MFSFKAYFWNNDVYINEKNKYAANEILTAYLNTNYLSKAEDYLYELKNLRRKLLISEDMDYSYYEHYNDNVKDALFVFGKINTWLQKLPPYNKILPLPIKTLEDVLNENSIVFEDGIESDTGYDSITWDTVTETGYGEQLDNGNFTIHITKFILQERYISDEYDAHMQEYAAELNSGIEKFFDGYIEFLKSYISVHKVFAPFVSEYLNSEKRFLKDNEVAAVFKKFVNEYGKPFGNIQCIMNTFSYTVLTDLYGKPMLCEKISFADLKSFLFYDLFSGIKRNYIPNKCNHCGRFFLIRAGKYYSYCDCTLKDEPDKTCRDVGSRRCYDDKCKSDPVWQTYNRAYKAHYARYMKKKMTVSEFEEWSRFASDIRDKALAEEIPFEQYYADIRK